jgi:hypothetical protein
MAPNRLSRSGRVELTLGLLALAGILAAGAALAVRREAPVEPGLVVNSAELDFGTVWEQPAFRHTFAVTNPTDRSVRVADIQTGCGCTTIEPRSFTVAPGGRQELTAALNLAGRAGNRSVGAFRVELLPLIAHQPPGSRTVWVLKGDVRQNPIELPEPVIDFGDEVVVGAPVPSRTVEVSVPDGSSLTELRAVVSGDVGTARVAPAGPGRWRVDIAPTDGLPRGPFAFAVRVEASAAGAGPFPAKEVRVTGTVRDDVAAWPATVNFGALEIGETGREYVVLASHVGRPFRVTRVEEAAGTTARPAEEQVGDGSRTFVVEQQSVEPGHQVNRVAFHVAFTEPPPGSPSEMVVALETAYYGTASRP